MSDEPFTADELARIRAGHWPRSHTTVSRVLATLSPPRASRIRALIDDRFAELFALVAVLGVFALTDPGDRVGFATGAVVASLAWLVATGWKETR